MSILSLQIPATLQAREHARNICYPDARFYQELAGANNHALAYRKKCVFTRSHDLFTLDSGGATWRWHCHTGYGTSKLALCGVLGSPYNSTGVGSPIPNDPFVTISVTKVGGATTDTEWHYAGTNATPTDAPSEWGTFYTEISVDPNSDYTGAVTSTNYGRVITLTVHEIGLRTVSGAVDFYTEHEAVAGAPILDANIQKSIEGPSKMLLKNGALQVNWGLYNGAARTRSNATLANLVDGSTTGTPTATTPGYRLVTTGRNTRSATTVPIRMAVYASIAAGSGTVKLRDTSAADAVTVTVNNATPQWFTNTGALSVGTGQKYDLMWNGDGANTCTVYAVSFYEYGT